MSWVLGRFSNNFILFYVLVFFSFFLSFLQAEEIKHLQRDDSELKESYGIQNGDVKGVKCETSHSKYVAENYADLKFSRTCLHDVMLLGMDI